jgi:hypothetical protein
MSSKAANFETIDMESAVEPAMSAALTDPIARDAASTP